MKTKMSVSPTSILTLLLTLLGYGVSASCYGSTQKPDGAALYLSNCSNCHGVYGEGDGPVSPDLPVTLLDLRYLSQRNGGEFPADFVTDIVDGRITRSSHGPEGMPVWGAEFARDTGSASTTDIDTAVQEKTAALNQFLRSIQINE